MARRCLAVRLLRNSQFLEQTNYQYDTVKLLKEHTTSNITIGENICKYIVMIIILLREREREREGERERGRERGRGREREREREREIERERERERERDTETERDREIESRFRGLYQLDTKTTR